MEEQSGETESDGQSPDKISIENTEPPEPPNQPAGTKHAHKMIIGYLSLILVLAVITAVYSWQHRNVNALKVEVTALNIQVANLQKQDSSLKSVVSKNQNKSSSPTTVSKMLQIKQLGIAIPLTASDSDLSYVWENNGSYALIGSSSLMTAAEKDNPLSCTSSVATSTNDLYPISFIGTNSKLSAQTPVKSVTVGGKKYYWSLPGSADCDVGRTISAFNIQAFTYYETVLGGFGSSMALTSTY